ncbi:MAG TPA: D-sedoheptulose 7-phosphate isomerase [Bacteroidales bacterium]|nr:D-sedoheptulose 7-phosphate isomerase [Bacteroidales bacterium]HRT89345.1 D-sedoheptulose 7-phosphate isomerase [Bacteroidales bacterium]
MEDIRKQVEDSIRVMQALLTDDLLIKEISNSAEVCVEALKAGRKILIAGNGGSAADAQHMAGELVNRFMFERPGLSAIALTTDTSVLTSVSNDSGFEEVFSRQVEALGSEGDVLILISTSGRSMNILKAAETAHKKNVSVIGLTGRTGGQMDKYCDLLIKVPSDNTPRIQECHILIEHILCSIIENKIFKGI